MDNRIASINRTTGETDIKVSVNLDGTGTNKIETGIGFFDHMLNLMAKHGFMNVDIKAEGDLYVDCHHTIEDVGIAFGTCIKEALGDKNGIKRYGTSYVPMDETLALVSLDISGRPYLVFDAEFTNDRVGAMDTEMVEEFMRAFAFNAGITLHVKIIHGKNNHHKIEGIFKALGRALKEAIEKDSRIKGVMSTKGLL